MGLYLFLFYSFLLPYMCVLPIVIYDCLVLCVPNTERPWKLYSGNYMQGLVSDLSTPLSVILKSLVWDFYGRTRGLVSIVINSRIQHCIGYTVSGGPF